MKIKSASGRCDYAKHIRNRIQKRFNKQVGKKMVLSELSFSIRPTEDQKEVACNPRFKLSSIKAITSQKLDKAWDKAADLLSRETLKLNRKGFTHVSPIQVLAADDPGYFYEDGNGKLVIKEAEIGYVIYLNVERRLRDENPIRNL